MEKSDYLIHEKGKPYNIPPRNIKKRVTGHFKILTKEEIRELKHLNQERQKIEKLEIMSGSEKESLRDLYQKEKSIWNKRKVFIVGINFETVCYKVHFNNSFHYSQFLNSLREKFNKGLMELGDFHFRILSPKTAYEFCKLENSFMSLSLYKDSNYNSNCKVTLKSKYTWQEGYKNAIKESSSLISKIDQNYLSFLSRFDLTIDVTGIEFTPEDLTRFVTRAKERDEHYVKTNYGRKFSGFTFGKGNLMVRIYNKTLEIQRSKKTWLYDIWKKNNWDGKSPVWRIEFQHTKNRIKGTQAFDLMFPSEDISTLLMKDFKWLRLAIPSKADKNRGAWKTDYFWDFLRDTVKQEISKEASFSQVRAVEEIRPSINNLLPSWIGLASKMGAIMGIEDVDELLETLKNESQEYLQSRGSSLEEKISEKIKLSEKKCIYDYIHSGDPRTPEIKELLTPEELQEKLRQKGIQEKVSDEDVQAIIAEAKRKRMKKKARL